MAKGLLGGKYERNDAGVNHWLNEHGWGQDREFIGSGVKSFPFKKPNGGVLIVRAESYADAWRIAREMGATQIRSGSRR